MKELIPVITRLAERTHVPQMVGWIKDNPAQFEELIRGFDAVIEDFNGRPIDPRPSTLINQQVLRERFAENRLPKVAEILAEESIRWCLPFSATFIKVGKKLDRDKAAEDLVVGSMFDIYDEMMLYSLIFEDKYERGQLKRALVETLAHSPASPLYRSVFDRNRLDWMGQDGYDPKFSEPNRRFFTPQKAEPEPE